MRSSLDAPLRVEGLEIRPIIGDKDASLRGRMRQLVFVRDTLGGATNLVNSDGINAALAQTFGNAVAQIFVEQKREAHVAWLRAIRASISSG